MPQLYSLRYDFVVAIVVVVVIIVLFIFRFCFFLIFFNTNAEKNHPSHIGAQKGDRDRKKKIRVRVHRIIDEESKSFSYQRVVYI